MSQQNKLIFCNQDDITLRHKLDAIAALDKKRQSINDLLILDKVIDIVKETIQNEVANHATDHTQLESVLNNIVFTNDPRKTAEDGQLLFRVATLTSYTKYVDTTLTDEEMSCADFVNNITTILTSYDAPLSAEDFLENLQDINNDIVKEITNITTDNDNLQENIVDLLGQVTIVDNNAQELVDEYNALSNTDNNNVKLYRPKNLAKFQQGVIDALILSDKTTANNKSTEWHNNYDIIIGDLGSATQIILSKANAIQKLYDSIINTSKLEATLFALQPFTNETFINSLNNAENQDAVDELINETYSSIESQILASDNPNKENIQVSFNLIRNKIAVHNNHKFNAQEIETLNGLFEDATEQLNTTNNTNNELRAEIAEKTAELEEHAQAYEEKYGEPANYDEFVESTETDLPAKIDSKNSDTVDSFIETVNNTDLPDVTDFTLSLDTEERLFVGDTVRINITNIIPELHKELHQSDIIVTKPSHVFYDGAITPEGFAVYTDLQGAYTIKVTIDGVEKSINIVTDERETPPVSEFTATIDATEFTAGDDITIHIANIKPTVHQTAIYSVSAGTIKIQTENTVVVNIDEPGEYTLTISCGEVSQDITFVVNPKHVQSFTLDASATEITVGETVTLTINNIEPAVHADDEVQIVTDVEYTLENDTITFTPETAGEFDITVNIGEATQTVHIVVNELIVHKYWYVGYEEQTTVDTDNLKESNNKIGWHELADGTTEISFEVQSNDGNVSWIILTPKSSKLNQLWNGDEEHTKDFFERSIVMIDDNEYIKIKLDGYTNKLQYTIKTSDDEISPVEPEPQEQEYYWYVGHETESNAMNSEYLVNLVNGQNATTSVDGPSTLTIPTTTGEILLYIYPTIWGTPNIVDSTGYGTGDDTFENTGLTSPDGYHVTYWTPGGVEGKTLNITWTK